jgi:uncharacterized membrane protein
MKGQMARRLVYFCLTVLTLTTVWAMVLKSVGASTGYAVDLTDVLTFVGAVFGGELLMLLVKRIFAKPTEQEEYDHET